MKRILLIVLLILSKPIYAQDIVVTFSGEIQETETTVTLDSINIKNLTQDTSITIPGNSGLNLNTGEIVNVPLKNEQISFQVFPNPISTRANIEFYVKDYENVLIRVSNLEGQIVANWDMLLNEGSHNCQFFPGNSGIYFISVHMGGTTVTSKAISLSRSNTKSEIVYQHTMQTEDKSTILKSSNTTDFPYTIGDNLKYTGYYNDYATVMVDSPVVSMSYTFDLIECMDYDGNSYQVAEIGTQWWMAENLKTTHYTDESAIPLVENNSGWDSLGYSDKAYCWFGNSTSNRDIYGALYTWAAAMNGAASDSANPSGVLGVCPDGWHLPSDAEWKELEMYLGMSQAEADNTGSRGTDEGGKLKEAGTIYWTSPNTGATNSSGFTALPGGSRFPNGMFEGEGYITVFWTATMFDASFVWVRNVSFDSTYVFRAHFDKDGGFSVRCVKDE